MTWYIACLSFEPLEHQPIIHVPSSSAGTTPANLHPPSVSVAPAAATPRLSYVRWRRVIVEEEEEEEEEV